MPSSGVPAVAVTSGSLRSLEPTHTDVPASTSKATVSPTANTHPERIGQPYHPGL